MRYVLIIFSSSSVRGINHFCKRYCFLRNFFGVFSEFFEEQLVHKCEFCD